MNHSKRSLAELLALGDEDFLRAYLGDPEEYVGSKHHTVPAIYLKQFSDSDGYLEVRAKGFPDRYSRTHVRQTASERDFYTHKNANEQSHSLLEALFGKLETLFQHDLREFSRFVENPKGYDLVFRHDVTCAYIASQILRTTGMRDLVQGISHQFSKFDLKGFTGPDDNQDHLNLIADLLEPFTKQLMAKPVLMVFWENKCLMTSDTPFMSIESQEAFLSSTGTQFFPLNPKAALLFGPEESNEGLLNFVQGDSELAQLLNNAIIRDCHKEYFATPSSSEADT